MIEKTLGEIAQIVGGTLHGAPDSRRVKGVCIDSRRIEPDNLYIPLIGSRVDGHQFARSISDTMAASLWKDDHPIPEFPVIVVKDPLVALQTLASEYGREISPFIIGITGSNGKTSTKDWLASILSASTKTQKTQGNHNNEIGLPLTLLELDPDCRVAILEMGMEKSGEIEFLTSLARPNLSIITSIGSAHLENFEDKSGIARAKLEIAGALKEDEPLFWPAFSDELQKLMEQYSKTAYSFGEADADYPFEMVPEEQGMKMYLNGTDYHIPAVGFQALNAALAICVADYLKISPEKIQQGLDSASLTAHRGERIVLDEIDVIDDSYKANPESMIQALELLATSQKEQKIAILADMLDLGENSRLLHEQIGQKAKELGLKVFAYGDQARFYTDQNERYFTDKEQLVRELLPLLDRPASLLIKGSNAMKMWEILEALQNWRQSNGKD